MSTPFINPYETKDVVATSLNNLDKQSQDIVSYLDGLFSSETVKDKQLILDDGTVETLKPFQVANSQGAFWDKGTTYYFQPVADRLREISLELQGRLQQTDVSASLKAGITDLFSKTLNDSRSQVSNDGKDDAKDDASDWKYEQLYTKNTSDGIYSMDLDNFLNAVGTAAFKMADASSDEDTNTKAVTNNSALNIDVNVDGIAELLDDGDNFYNDDNTIDNPNTTDIEGADSNKQPEFYLIGNKKLPVFGVVENAPNPADLAKYPGGTANADYKRDLYNYQNKRIDPNSIYWNEPDPLLNPLLTKKPEEVFFDMVAIAISQQKPVGSVTSADSDSIRDLNKITAQAARNNLKSIAGNYFTDSKAWYDSVPAPSRNLSTANLPTPPSFFLSKSTSGTINYSNYDGSYGVFKPTEPGTLTSLISDATGLSASDVDSTLTNWDTTDNTKYVDRIIQYYTQSYLNASITSTFGKKDAAISTKSFLIHEALNNLEPLQNPYIEEVVNPGTGDRKIVVKFDKLLSDVTPSGYLRSSGNPTGTYMSNQMTQLMDLFLENFDITASRYVEDKRTLVDLFSGKLLGENTEVQKMLFQNINSATKDITSQIKNALTRGIAESAESQFTLDLFNQTAVRKEDYGLSPNPADTTKHFLPSGWANTKDKFLPAMYYYNPANNPPISGSDEANNTLNGTDAKNGLPAGFPIMDVRDFDQFFKATKLALTNHIKTYLNDNIPLVINNKLSTLYKEMDSFLTDPNVLATYPSWTTAGFTAGSQAAIFGDLSDQTNFSRAIQLYKSLDKIIDNMGDRVSSVEQYVPKIPRPKDSNVINPNTRLAVTLTLQSSIAGYGDKPSPALVKSFLEMHEDTKTSAASPDNSLQQISYLINTFDDYSKFSQNSAFEKIYAGEVFEADKQNYTSLNAKKSEPGPDGSMPEDKGVPKPLMAALSSSILVTKLGQVLVNKVNDIVAKVNDIVTENDDISINTVTRKDGPNENIGKIDTDTTTLSGSKESQIYLTNILSQVHSLSAAGNLSVDVSAVGALISDDIETGMKTLIKETDVGGSTEQRMVFIDDTTLTELINLRDTLNRFSVPITEIGLTKLKELLTNANLGENTDPSPPGTLKAKAYPSAGKAPGYLNFTQLLSKQQELINNIRDGQFTISGSDYSFDGGTTVYTLSPTVPAAINDSFLTTLNTLGGIILSSKTDTPPRKFINGGSSDADKIFTALDNAKVDFTTLINKSDTRVNYDDIINSDVVGEGALAGHPDESQIITARKKLLDDLIKDKKIGGVNFNKLKQTDPGNPFLNIVTPVSYPALNPATLPNLLPSALTPGTTPSKLTFQNHISSIETFIKRVQTSLNSASDPTIEKPPRAITPADDPILALSQLAKLDLGELKKTANSIWGTPITDPLSAGAISNIKTAIINSDVVGEGALAGRLDELQIKADRGKLLEFFLENKLLDPFAVAGPNNYKLTDITTHIRYKDLITPTTYPAYPSNTDITNGLAGLPASANPLALNSTVDNSKADSFTLREIMGCHKNLDDVAGDVPFRNAAGKYLDADGNISAIPDNTLGFKNSLNDLEFKMRNGEFTVANKKLYIRKMQHFNVLFNTLSGGTDKNPPLDSFAAPPTLFGDPLPTQNLKQYIESLATSDTITSSSEFQNIVKEVEKLAPIVENINALEGSFAGKIKKPKAGPESEIYSTLRLFTQIENQIAGSDNLEAGMIQLLNKRKIKDDTQTPTIVDLEHRAATAISPKDGLYQYSGYEANLQYLDPANSPSISGPNKAPDTTGNQRWNLRELLEEKIGSTADNFPPFPPPDPAPPGPPVSKLVQARDFLVALNEVYKDMQASKSPVIKEQLKVFDLWLRNNSFSAIGDVALGGKDSLEADINILDHIQEGGGTSPTTINDFLKASKQKTIAFKAKLEDLDDIRTAGKGFAQRIDDGLTASALRNYFQKNIFYPSATPFPSAAPFPKAGLDDTRVDFTKDYFGRYLNDSNLSVFGLNIFGTDPKTGIKYTVPLEIQAYYANANSLSPYTAPTNPLAPSIPDPKRKAGLADTRADFTKDFFGRPLDNSNLPVFGVNIFGLDPDSGTTYTAPLVPPAPPMPGTIVSNSYKNFGLTDGPNLDNPYQKIMDNINTLLGALTAAEAAGRSKEQGLYRVMIKNLLGESGGVPDAQLIAGALAENPNSFIPNHPSLVNVVMELTYNTNNYPSANLRTKILDVRNKIGDVIDPAKYDGVIPIPNTTLANFSLMSKADQATNVRSVGVEGKSIQELAILLYIMQMFEASNWDYEKYINDTSRYEMEPAVE